MADFIDVYEEMGDVTCSDACPMSRRAYRRQMHERALQRRKDIVLHTNAMALGVGIDRTGETYNRSYWGADPQKYRYIRRPKNSHVKQYLRKIGNRKFRRDKEMIAQAKGYNRKMFNALWNFY